MGFRLCNIDMIKVASFYFPNLSILDFYKTVWLENVFGFNLIFGVVLDLSEKSLIRTLDGAV